jgi:hypothetical protein
MLNGKPTCGKCGSSDIRLGDCPLCGNETLIRCADCSFESCQDDLCSNLNVQKRWLERLATRAVWGFFAFLVLILAFHGPLQKSRPLAKKSAPVIPSVSSIAPSIAGPLMNLGLRPVASPSPGESHRAATVKPTA